jgi:hypothetical protein
MSLCSQTGNQTDRAKGKDVAVGSDWVYSRPTYLKANSRPEHCHSIIEGVPSAAARICRRASRVACTETLPAIYMYVGVDGSRVTFSSCKSPPPVAALPRALLALDEQLDTVLALPRS